MTDIAQKAQEEIIFDVSDEALEVAADAAKVHGASPLVLAPGCLSAPVRRLKSV